MTWLTALLCIALIVLALWVWVISRHCAGRGDLIAKLYQQVRDLRTDVNELLNKPR